MLVNHSFSHCQLASQAVSQSFSQPASQPASGEVILWVSPSVSEPIKLFLATVKVTPGYHLVITLLLIIKCLDVKVLFSTYKSDTIYFSLLCQVTNILFNCFFLKAWLLRHCYFHYGIFYSSSLLWILLLKSSQDFLHLPDLFSWYHLHHCFFVGQVQRSRVPTVESR